MFVAISDVPNAKLTLYSGRYFRFAFDYRGTPASLSAALLSTSRTAEDAVRVTRSNPLGLRVDLPKIASWNVRSPSKHLDQVLKKLERECQDTGLNNYRSAVDQYLFRFSDPSHTRVLAGPGSAKQFRLAMADRLAEYARNLQWLRGKRGKQLRKETAAFLAAVTSLKPFLPKPAHFRKALKALHENGAV
jgi:hypothetical protein